MWRLNNPVRQYAWGSTTAIPKWLGVEPDGQPQAELWMGAHATAPSEILTETEDTALDAAIAEDPKQLLGEDVILRFGERLPYLLKLLAVREPLSLQVHPCADRAQAGYTAENAADIPAGAPHRNYPDPYAKPELVVALEPFDALCGFRSPRVAATELRGLTSLLARELHTDLTQRDPAIALRSAMRRLLTLDEPRRDTDVVDLVAELGVRMDNAPDGSSASNFPVTLELAERYPGDPGAIAALLLNHVTLSPGEAMFLPAGNVHAYLRGTAVEIMGCSDNVLRGGLTPKHVDSAEFLDVVDFSCLDTTVTPPRGHGARRDYAPGIPEFVLSIIDVDWESNADAESNDAVLQGPAIAFSLSGETRLTSVAPSDEIPHPAGASTLSLWRGESVFVPASRGPVGLKGRGQVAIATVGAS